MLILTISFCDWYRWGWPKCIGFADSKLREKHIRKYRRSALCIAVSRFILLHAQREFEAFLFALSFLFRQFWPFEQRFQMTSTYINSISRVKTRKLSIRFCKWICQFPTWRRRYCFDIFAARMTWRYISHNSLLSGLSFRHSNNHLWRVTCHGNVPLLSFAGPLLQPALRQSRQLTNFAYSQFRKTTLCYRGNLI